MFMVANQRHSIDFLVRCESGQSVLSYLLQLGNIAFIVEFFRIGRSRKAFTCYLLPFMKRCGTIFLNL